jgi:hypothetical protein
MLDLTKDSQHRFVASLMDLVAERAGDEDNTRLLVTLTLLEAINRLDPGLVGPDFVERLTLSPVWSIRASAASVLWDKARATPGAVPIDMLGRLVRPSAEDWYVAAPAMAATKTLILVRREAYEILERLAGSASADDRAAVIDALMDIARVNPAAVKRTLAQRLTGDGEEEIARAAWVVVKLTQDVGDEAPLYSPFAM